MLGTRLLLLILFPISLYGQKGIIAQQVNERYLAQYCIYFTRFPDDNTLIIREVDRKEQIYFVDNSIYFLKPDIQYPVGNIKFYIQNYPSSTCTEVYLDKNLYRSLEEKDKLFFNQSFK